MSQAYRPYRLTANTMVLVKLTRAGHRILQSHDDTVNEHFRRREAPARVNYMDRVVDDLWTIELWSAMQLLGPHCHIGNTTLFEWMEEA